MRKYAIAALASVAVFAMAAFAAGLVVNGGVLQAGADNDLTCGDEVDVSYKTSNDTTGHWIGELYLQFDEACEGSFAVVNGFGPAANNQILSLISNPIDANGQVSIDIFDGPTRVADLINLQVLVKDTLTSGECSGFEASGNPIQIRQSCP